MTNPLLIIISGHPSTGKTTLGKRLAQELNLCFISRDDLKESLFDNLGWKDREWSKKLGIASYKLLYHFIESLLVAGHSFIAESNFDPEYDTSRFLELKRKYGFNSFQVQCKTDGEVLFQRFKVRSESGERHPGHVDHLNYKEFKETFLTKEIPSLDIGGTVLEVDTTDFERVAIDDLLRNIRGKLPGRV